jgi:hypothetical protein
MKLSAPKGSLRGAALGARDLMPRCSTVNTSSLRSAVRARSGCLRGAHPRARVGCAVVKNAPRNVTLSRSLARNLAQLVEFEREEPDPVATSGANAGPAGPWAAP